jgi:hypothetical protein
MWDCLVRFLRLVFAYQSRGERGLTMSARQYLPCLLKCVFFLPVALPALGAEPDVLATQPKVDCSHYQQQQQANLGAWKRADPAIHDEWLDSVFYSAKQNSCLATVSFIKHGSTYNSIFDIPNSRPLWTRSYRGKSFSPAHVVAMDFDLYQKMEEFGFAPAP